MQDIFLQVYRRLDSYRGEAALGTWLHRLAVNACLDFAAEQAGPPPAGDGLRSRIWTRSSRPATGRGGADAALDRLDLERAIAQLPPSYRRAFLLHDVEGLEHHEIGEALGIAEGTSKSLLHKARTRLRTLLRGRGGRRRRGRPGRRLSPPGRPSWRTVMERHTSADPACDRFAALIHDRVDGALDARRAGRTGRAPRRRAPACRALAGRSRGDARASAASCRDLTPRPEVWAGLAQRLAAEQVAARPRPFWTGARVALAMAATLVVAVASSVWLLRARPARSRRRERAAHRGRVIQSRQDLVQDVDEHLRIADEHYVEGDRRARAGGEERRGLAGPGAGGDAPEEPGRHRPGDHARAARRSRRSRTASWPRRACSRRSGRRWRCSKTPSRSSTSCGRATRRARPRFSGDSASRDR